VGPSNDHLIDDIRGLFAEKWAIQVESPFVDLLDTGLVDSVTLVELLLELEQRFGVSLPLENLEIEDFRSVAKIADLVGRTRTGGVAAAVAVSPIASVQVSAAGAAA
jgi:acyl carrier protein